MEAKYIKLIVPTLLIAGWVQYSPAVVAQDTIGTANEAQTIAVAMGGFDPTSYFSGDLPVAGQQNIYHIHQGQYYYFASIENRDAFVANPVKYSPQYAGHCAHSFSQTIERLGDPSVFNVDKDGKLFLFADKGAKEAWLKNVTEYKELADKRWQIRQENITKYKVTF
ncbi:hypothetical protein KFE96_09425 [Kordiimonas sp. SCSIO 12603]|uniref:YHS domain-containing (seleno)protein n=1 Tax=Kordiimonas sp. SCSIO 12603 TaxID=2829596 RepID=UPI0021083185|nr:YHS domain-containing (seleno)protein [Kordiimonas sp. SCSIO 12603]UTW57086.1 hypothetical protein KFE96_09425 [Kordiimonas sp. SCSIO 12603]